MPPAQRARRDEESGTYVLVSPSGGMSRVETPGTYEPISPSDGMRRVEASGTYEPISPFGKKKWGEASEASVANGTTGAFTAFNGYPAVHKPDDALSYIKT